MLAKQKRGGLAGLSAALSFDSSLLFKHDDLGRPCDETEHTLSHHAGPHDVDAGTSTRQFGHLNPIFPEPPPVSFTSRGTQTSRPIHIDDDVDGSDTEDNVSSSSDDVADRHVDADSSTESDLSDTEPPSTAPGSMKFVKRRASAAVNEAERTAERWANATAHLSSVGLMIMGPFKAFCCSCNGALEDEIRYRCNDCWKSDLCQDCQLKVHPDDSLCRWTYCDPRMHFGGFRTRPDNIIQFNNDCVLLGEGCDCQPTYRVVKIVRLGGGI